uniref:NADH-ubiquinone oxidoreductase chain 6 n=1 Tax=Velarifictorus hemelytrus TaxID=1874760 RepID=A0A1B1SHN9_9ORTH|nr:NADH dehydrogenase subunit 6 [Velarifictorus hemelytrus]ANU83252.1 NADH dehydrogenase subunit 6 [Velarifictorus hemelytrus]
MFIMIMVSIIMTINIIITMSIHPLAITLLIILQTLSICLIVGPLSYSFWFSYILFLIFLGGMLVLFIYITTLASNELFQLPTKTILMLTFLMIISLLMSNMLNQIPSPLKYSNDSINNNLMNISTENNLNQLYNYPNLTLTIMTIMYLLITLIIIVKITHINEGPLRQSH